MIRISHLRKEYADVTPLKDVSATIENGEVVAIIGPSGTGKSTLLRCINLLERPTSGEIWIDDVDVCDPATDIRLVRQRVGMVFQSFNLFGHLSAIENIMLSPVTLKGMGKQEAYDRGMALLRQVGLADKARSYPDELSGGQQRRIAIVRTLAMDPAYILLDEPTSALDPTMVGEVRSVIRELAQTDKTLLIVTHEMRLAETISNRVLYMDQGSIYEEGPTAEIFAHPRRERTRRFVQRLKVLEVTVTSQTFDFPAAVGQIEHYCNENQIAGRLANRIQLVFEELVRQTLVPAMPTPDIVVQVEYAESTSSASLTVRYAGERIDVTDITDELTAAVLRGSSTEMTYEWLEGQARPNQLIVRIRP